MARPELLIDAPGPLSDESIARLRPLAERYATERVARALGVSRQGLLAALAGLPVMPKVRHAIDVGLADLASAISRVTA